MPGGDGTGPMGMGPMTGRAAGNCAGYGVPGQMNRIPGRGLGMGRGGGRGFRHWYYATGLTRWQRAAMGWPAPGVSFAGSAAAPVVTKEQQVDALKAQADVLAEQLEFVRKRIEELSA